MEKWLVILGIWAMCATCAVLFIRGATRGPGRRDAEGHTPAASRASASDARTALNE
ncbi:MULTISPECIES: hypothetical protein [Paraburkholderia]|jgi:hypothetical protein|uniref:Uncharacterized protein n=1 Tax=Paraburkholderia dipogonis TaxID=1211383 RepID=A0ABW9ANP8_9BURK|nr:hypothetical protein [Paraburkholderia sp. BL9I2N2]TCK97380.1 hypothetical protein B0G74_4088 [Paraburkholderia sp. BL9I2N2]